MYAIEFKGGTSALLITATHFKVNNRSDRVIFKNGFKNVALYNLSEIRFIHRVKDDNEWEDLKKAKSLGVI